MTDFQLTTALETMAGIIFLSVLVFDLVPAYRLDSFRQTMFTLRDQLWDYAAAGTISFDDPAYMLLRKLMNGFIRYGHQLTFFRVLMTTLHWHSFGQAPELTWHNKWNRALSQVKDPETRTFLENAHQRAMMVMVKHLITGSPVLLALLLAVSLWMIIRSGLTNLRQLFKSSGLKSLGWIVDPALIEESAASYRRRSGLEFSRRIA
jgi:hypothetical protein